MDGLLTLSNDLAAAVERAGQVVFGVNAKRWNEQAGAAT